MPCNLSLIERVHTIGFPALSPCGFVHPQESLDELNIVLRRSVPLWIYMAAVAICFTSVPDYDVRYDIYARRDRRVFLETR